MMRSHAADNKTKGHRRLRCAVWSLAGVLVVFLGICLWLGFYWDLNDDYLIDHILRGAYTGEPEIRDIQNLFPFSAILAGLQKLLQAVDVYAVLLVVLQFVSMWIIVDRTAVFAGGAETGRDEKRQDGRNKEGKQRAVRQKRCILAAIFSGMAALLLLVAELLYHLVFVQYSVTVGMMSAVVIALIMTTDKAQITKADGSASIPRILRSLAGAFVLVFLGFGLRSEMLLFCSPFIALAALIRGVELFFGERKSGGGKKSSVRNLLTWLLTIGLTCLMGLGVLKGCDLAGYRSPSWQKFEAFFDARTQLYDFQWTWMKHYEEDADWYDAAGLDSSEVTLLWNYNFGLDENITDQTLQTIASHAADTAAAQSSTTQRLRDALYAYRNTLLSSSDRPWNLIALALYVAVLVTMLATALFSKERGAGAGGRLLLQVLALFLLFACRSTLYVYLLYHQRPVVRLTHCLYLLESVCLLFFLLQIMRERLTVADPSHAVWRVSKKISQWAIACLLAGTLLLSGHRQMTMTASEYTRRESVNREWTQFLTYVSDHPDNFYFTDVYSTVAYSEQLSAVNAAYPLNWDLAGGWACRSPLWDKKLSRYQIRSMETALPDAANVYFVSSPDRDTDWLVAYYAYKGRKVQVEEVERISDHFSVYMVKTKEEP